MKITNRPRLPRRVAAMTYRYFALPQNDAASGPKV